MDWAFNGESSCRLVSTWMTQSYYDYFWWHTFLCTKTLSRFCHCESCNTYLIEMFVMDVLIYDIPLSSRNPLRSDELSFPLKFPNHHFHFHLGDSCLFANARYLGHGTTHYQPSQVKPRLMRDHHCVLQVNIPNGCPICLLFWWQNKKKVKLTLFMSPSFSLSSTLLSLSHALRHWWALSWVPVVSWTYDGCVPVPEDQVEVLSFFTPLTALIFKMWVMGRMYNMWRQQMLMGRHGPLTRNPHVKSPCLPRTDGRWTFVTFGGIYVLSCMLPPRSCFTPQHCNQTLSPLSWNPATWMISLSLCPNDFTCEHDFVSSSSFWKLN